MKISAKPINIQQTHTGVGKLAGFGLRLSYFCETLSQLLHISMLKYLHLQNEDNDSTNSQGFYKK